MSFEIVLATEEKTPIYKQLVSQFEDAIRSGRLKSGEQVPSMNEFAARYNISKETIKKVYGILRDKDLLVPRQGKGFYVAENSSISKPHILVLFDKLSIYKEVLYNSLVEELGENADITILTHNQNLEFFTYCLDTCLDTYDYYVITPHFPLDEKSQAMASKLMSRIPYRKLIMVDNWMKTLPGNYGAVYQDFENDIYEGLKQGINKLRQVSVLNVITLPSSLYGSLISRGVQRFCQDYDIPFKLMDSAPEVISKDEAFLVLSSQLDSGLAALARNIKANKLEVERDVFVISYNEFDLCEVVMNGLTTVSADFKQMGRSVARMILSRNMTKIHCDFSMNRRNTF